MHMASATALLSKADAEESAQKAYNYYLDALQAIVQELRLNDEVHNVEIEYSLLISHFDDAKLCLEKALNLAITTLGLQTRKPPLLPCQASETDVKSPDCQIVGIENVDRAKPLVPPRPEKSKATAALKAARSRGDDGNTTSNSIDLSSDQPAATHQPIAARRHRYSFSEYSLNAPKVTLQTGSPVNDATYLPKQPFAFNERQNPLERPLLPLHAHPVVHEGTVDPTNLVAAQTGSDFLDMNIGRSSARVPFIPVSPLVTFHRQNHARMEAASAKLDDIAAFAYSEEANDLDEAQIEASASGMLHVTVETCRAALAKNSTLIQLARSTTSLLSFPAHLLAYQLTLIDQAFFLQIDPNAILTHSPKTPDPAIAASTDFFNYVTRMVEHCILAPPEANVRAQVVHHWIKVANRLYDLRNFQTMKAVTSALSTPPIARLSKTWSCVPRKSNAKLEELRATMSEDGNYSRYREAMTHSSSSSSIGTNRYSRPSDSLSQWEVIDFVPNQNAPQYSINTVGSMKSVGPNSPVGSPTTFFTGAEARRPEIPFLGVFILDSTYIQAMASSNTTTAPLSGSLLGPTSPTIANVAAVTYPSPHLSELLSRLAYYQRGPRYTPTPPAAFLKLATRSHSRRLHLPLFLYSHPVAPVEEEELAVTQSVIMHWILTRDWVGERVIDELSRIREAKGKGEDRERRPRRASFEVEKLLAGSSFTAHSERAFSPSTPCSPLLPSALPATVSPDTLSRRRTEPYAWQPFPKTPQPDDGTEASSPMNSLNRLLSPLLIGPSLPPRIPPPLPVLPGSNDDRPIIGSSTHGKEDDSFATAHVVTSRRSEDSTLSTSAPDLDNDDCAALSDTANTVGDRSLISSSQEPSESERNTVTPSALKEDVDNVAVHSVLCPNAKAVISTRNINPNPAASLIEEGDQSQVDECPRSPSPPSSSLKKSPAPIYPTTPPPKPLRKVSATKDPADWKNESDLNGSPLPPKLPPRPLRKSSLSTEIQKDIASARD